MHHCYPLFTHEDAKNSLFNILEITEKVNVSLNLNLDLADSKTHVLNYIFLSSLAATDFNVHTLVTIDNSLSVRVWLKDFMLSQQAY